MFEVWFNYQRPHHSWRSTDGNKTGVCVHCNSAHTGDPASVSPCAAREGKMIVDGRTQDEAEEYIKQCSAPAEVEHWEVRPEKPVKLWSGAHVHHRGVFASARSSVADAKKYVESEERLPVAILLDGRVVRRASTQADADATIKILRASIDGTLTTAPHTPSTRPGHMHHRADARTVHTIGDWSIHLGNVVGKFDTVAEAEAYRDELLKHSPATADGFTITEN